MKILIITPYISTPIHPAFWTKAKQTGLGYIVNDIALYVGKKENVDLFAYVIMSPTIQTDGFRIIGHNYWSIFRYFRWSGLGMARRFLNKYPLPSLKETIKAYGKFLIMSQIEDIVENYDVVNIHGISEATSYTIDICKRHNVKYVVTLHGLISFEETVNCPIEIKNYEKDFLLQAAAEKIPVSFVSSGIKETAEKFIYEKSLSVL